jgi:hypothetical protein
MVSVVVSSVVYRGFGGVMVSVVVSRVVYRGFIGGVMFHDIPHWRRPR